MKFYPSKKVEREEIYSITWSKRRRAYVLSSDGEAIGQLEIGLEEYMKHHADDYDFLKELNLNIPVEEISASAYMQDSNLTGLNKLRMSLDRIVSKIDLPYGVFKLYSADGELCFAPFSTTVGNVNIIENKNLKQMVLDFFEKGVEGRKNKKGFLLFGPPGNGKTTEVMSLFSIADEMKCRIFIVDANLHLGYLHHAQKLLEGEKTIFIMEEVTERTSGRAIEHLLTFLDGENSWNNSVTIATTNYPEELPANLVDRPGRFDTFIEYDNPTKEDIIRLGEKFGFTAEECESLFKSGYSFDYVSYIMSVAKKENIAVKEAVKNETEKRRKISSTFKGKLGIY